MIAIAKTTASAYHPRETIMTVESDAKTTTRFRWGVALAWLPFAVFFVPAIIHALRGISASRATGVGAVAGGLAQAAAMFGIVALVVSEIAAVVLLAQSFARGHSVRGIFSVLSIGCAVFVVALIGLMLWLVSYSRMIAR